MSAGGTVRVAHSDAPLTQDALAAVLRDLADLEPALVLAFHSPLHDAGQVAGAMQDAFPKAATAGCSTAGEVSPAGFGAGGLVAVAFGGAARASATLLTESAVLTPAAATQVVADLTAGIRRSPLDLDPERQVFLTFTDGLAGSGEVLLAALGEAAAGMPIVGGSAGDGERLDRTCTWANGVVSTSATALVLLEPGAPFTTLGIHHFSRTDLRCVVTAATPSMHRVHELDGWPAAQRFAALTRVPEEALRAGALRPLALPRQLGFLVGDDLYMRALLDVDGDDLLLAGSVEVGMVLRVCEAGDLVGATRAGVADALRRLGQEPTLCLQFACVGRVIQCPDEHQDVLFSLGAVAQTAGFLTLGEQLGPLQASYTLAGLLLGGQRVG